MKAHTKPALVWAVSDTEDTYQDGEHTRYRVVARMTTQAEAEAWVGAREALDPEKVHRGAYVICGYDNREDLWDEPL
jgi:hypothetical protein